MMVIGVRLLGGAWLSWSSRRVRRRPGAGGGLDSLEIVTSTGRHAFQVEIANNDATREHGLMDRRYMARRSWHAV